MEPKEMIIPNRWNIRNLRQVVAEPRMLLGELNRLGVKTNQFFLDRLNQQDMCLVMERDWDILILLDACRSDIFEEVCWFEGDFSTIVSAGSESREFLHANFDGQYHDTVYITANPFASELDSDTFHAIYPLYESEWDAKYGTVPPDQVAAALRKANTNFPQKRLIAHFMQPHAPYIGDTTVPHSPANDPSETERTVWANLRYGLKDITINDVRSAYYANLRMVLEVIDDTIDDLDGKIVISADHGELLGDRMKPLPVRGYGHPPGLRAPQLVEVPWLEIPSSERRSIKKDSPILREHELSGEQLTDRLAALGYR